MEQKINDQEFADKWQQMLNEFNNIIKSDPQPEKVKDKLTALSESAMLTDYLTPRQKEGIVARCNNYINGTYGNKIQTGYKPYKGAGSEK